MFARNNLSLIRLYILRAVSTTRFIFALLLVLWTLPCCGQSAVVGEDAAHPVKRFTSDPSRVKDLQFSRFEFQLLYLGREGPNFTRLDGQPTAGAQYLVKAELFGQEVAATAKFELVDEVDRVIQLLHMSKSDNSLDHGAYAGFVKVRRSRSVSRSAAGTSTASCIGGCTRTSSDQRTDRPRLPACHQNSLQPRRQKLQPR